MITYITHNQIDKQRWDDCIEQSPNGNVYGLSWYLDIVHPCWEALVEDDYVSVMPLTGNRKCGVSYLFQPFFVQQLGMFSKETISSEKIVRFINAIPEKFKFAEIKLNSGNLFSSDHENIDNHRNIELDLSYDYAILSRNYSSNTKRDIAKAKAAGITVTDDVKPAEIVELFRKNRGKEVKHWGDEEYDRFLRLVQEATKRGHCFVKGTKNTDNQLVAGAVFMTSHNRIVFLFSGADELNKEFHALSFLIDETIKEYSGTGITFDFEGSDNDGLARFYKGFGGHEASYPGLRFNKTRGIIKLALKIFKNK